MVFWRLSFLPYLKSFFKRPVYLFWCPIRFLKYLSWQTNRQRRKNIKKPYLYLRGMDMVFWKYWPWGCISMKYITSIGYTMCPGYYWSTSSRVHLGSTMKIRRRKIEKTISIPARYRYGFLEILLKTHPNRYVMHLHESNMCSFAEDISKTAKNNKKPYLYHTGIDMVWAKMSKASLDLYRVRVRGRLEVFRKFIEFGPGNAP